MTSKKNTALQAIATATHCPQFTMASMLNIRTVHARSVFSFPCAGARQGCRRRVSCRAEGNAEGQPPPPAVPPPAAGAGLDAQLNKLTKQTATTFAPRPSGAVKNPAVKGSWLYTVFEVQAWLAVLVGGLLAFNVLYPTDEPSIPRLLGMWSIWMFTIPSLRARECTAEEKDALNLLFLLVPLLNVALPFVWKSFGFVFTADVAAMAIVYYQKGLIRLSGTAEP